MYFSIKFINYFFIYTYLGKIYIWIICKHIHYIIIIILF